MRRTLSLFPLFSLFLLALSLPAFAAPPEAPRLDAVHRTQSLRAGEGEPRVRETTAARAAGPRKAASAQGTARSRPYQAAKPGEGAPKD